MKQNIGLIMIIIGSLMPGVTLAGRHSIARDEANNIVNARFAEFYRNEARRLAEQQAAMEREIAASRRMAEDMIRNLQRTTADSGVTTAEDLERRGSDANPDLNPTGSDETAAPTPPVDPELNAEPPTGQRAPTDLPSRARRARQFNTTSGTSADNPFIFLQDLEHAAPVQRAAGINEVVNSIRSVPNSQQLAADFAQDLGTIAPTMAQEFTAAYNAMPAKQLGTTSSNVATAKPQPATSNNPSAKLGTQPAVASSTKAQHAGAVISQGVATQKPKIHHHPPIIKDQVPAATFNPITTYTFSAQRLYPIYTAPNKVTVISLAPGETIVGNPVCGDLTRWKLSIVEAGANTQYLMVQPVRAGLSTSITVVTKQGRTYVLEAISLNNNYMALVKWSY